MIQVEVAFISVDANIGTPIVFLRETDGDPRRMLPIWIGQAEALAIQLKLKNEEPPRPMTHDLLKNIIETLSAKVESIHVHSIKEETFLAEIHLQVNKEVLKVDARPSDAIALSLRFDVPIYVTEELIEQSGFSEEELKESEQKQQSNTLADLDEDTLAEYEV
ncbi:TPA: bifunctional nuclease family protein [Candidatus Poribacteria bacterium]|jgi:bifunctional DNase/RNase|nr:bifunctional nuclease family protein [Candidatus Poribacteria bacterium]HIA68428.1 bifunctional nuclease family protein [Candidatus Poribacteria bacterium]HIB86755.1 bifunctional nuclease family protein [Candidatus Poribacteria bacterium]HIB99745.1 bifunctional nuclease family protein [Candidatus Poribacteria bacterium]HIN30231.1 bifunctional nuclease family protein [Candidatus Poribacteria bacterium]